MSRIPLAAELAAAAPSAIRQLSALARDGVAEFGEFFSGLSGEASGLDAAPVASELPFSAQSLQQRLADGIVEGKLTFQGADDTAKDASISLPAHVSDLRDWAEEKLVSLQTRLSQKLQEVGVDLTHGVELTIRPDDGSITVVGDHPQRRAIEEALGNDSPLSREIHEATAVLDLLRAARDNPAFAQDYVRDARQALADNQTLFQSSGSAARGLIVDDTRIWLAR